MSIERKTGLFYELLIRGNCAEPDRLGAWSGSHLIEGEAIVEDGKVISYAPGKPQPLERDKVAELIGAQAAELEAQKQALMAERDAADAARRMAEGERDAALATARDLDAARAALIDQLAASRAEAQRTAARLQSIHDVVTGG